MPSFQELILMAPPILLALTVHEYSHGYVAYRLGDDTAYRAGRLTLNPLSHLDPIGTLMLFIAQIGWAKPVPVNPYNLNNPQKDMIWVALAGPASNVVFAFIVSMLLRFIIATEMNIGVFLAKMIVFTIQINLVLAAFNLIPVPPLDGSKILGGFLRGEAAYKYAQFERIGPFVLMAVIFGGWILHIPVLSWIITPFVQFFYTLFVGI